MKITDETLKRLKEANLSNLVRKIKSGKSLNATELRLLNESSNQSEAPDDNLKTWGDLAKALGFSRRSISTWRKRPDAPAKPDLDEWKAYVTKHQLGTSPTNQPTVNKELQAEKLKREIALLDIKVAKERRQVIPADEIDGLLSRIASRQRAELIQWCETESPVIVAGGDLGEIRDNQRILCDKLCDLMASGIRRWLGDVKKVDTTKEDG